MVSESLAFSASREGMEKSLDHLQLENAWSHFKGILLTDEAYSLTMDLHFLPLMRLIDTSSLPLSMKLEKKEFLFTSLKDVGLKCADLSFYNSLLQVYALNGNVEKSNEIVKEMAKLGTFKPSVETYNCFIQLYFNAPDMSSHAIKFYNRMAEEGVSANFETFRIMIISCTEHSMFNEALEYWKLLCSSDLPVHDDIHQCLILCMCELGSSDLALEHVKSLTKLYPNLNHDYVLNCIAALCSKLELLEKAQEIIQICSQYNDSSGIKLSMDILSMLSKSYILVGDLDGACKLLSQVGGIQGDNVNKASKQYKTFSSQKLSMYESTLSLACKEKNTSLVDDLLIGLKQDSLYISSNMLQSLVEMHVNGDSLDEALELFENYKVQCLQLYDNAELTSKTYDYLLAGMAAQYRMKEFTSMWEEILDSNLATSKTCLIALESYIRVKNVPLAYQVCELIISDEKFSNPSVDILLDLFESAAITSRYTEMTHILRWIRDITDSPMTTKTEIQNAIRTRIVPLSQSIERFLSQSSEDVPEESISTLDQPPAILLYEEFLALEASLPYSLFAAVIKYYHLRKDMVEIAKTMSVVIKQSHNPNQPAPTAECVGVFLRAASDLCGKAASSSVLKLVYSEGLLLNYDGYSSLLALATKFGWLGEMTALIEAMDAKRMKMKPKLYGYLRDILEKEERVEINELLESYMERKYPEVLGEWMDIRDEEEVINAKRESVSTAK